MIPVLKGQLCISTKHLLLPTFHTLALKDPTTQVLRQRNTWLMIRKSATDSGLQGTEEEANRR